MPVVSCPQDSGDPRTTSTFGTMDGLGREAITSGACGRTLRSLTGGASSRARDIGGWLRWGTTVGTLLTPSESAGLFETGAARIGPGAMLGGFSRWSARSRSHAGQRTVPMGLYVSHDPQTTPSWRFTGVGSVPYRRPTQWVNKRQGT